MEDYIWFPIREITSESKKHQSRCFYIWLPASKETRMYVKVIKETTKNVVLNKH